MKLNANILSNTLITILSILVFTFGVKIVSKQHKIIKKQEQIVNNENEILKTENQIKKKLALKDDILQINNVKFYVPYYPTDGVQREIVDKNEFFELKELKKMDEFLPENANILDIGANIGNHTLYWLTTSTKKANHVYSFEVIDKTYNILKKNIEINNLQNKTTLFNFGLGNSNTSASINRTWFINDFGSVQIKEDKGGEFKIKRLDDVQIDKKIDFIKIDVEGFEFEVLKGAKNTLIKNKPLIWIELWDEDKKNYAKKGNKQNINNFLAELGYKMVYALDSENFLYKYENKDK